MKYADVILPLPLEGVFTYAVPEIMACQVKRGVRVHVPLGKSKKYIGIVQRVHEDTPDYPQIKDILQVLDEKPVLLETQLNLWDWIAQYYMSPLGEVFNAAMPLGLKAMGGYKPKMETYISLGEKFRTEQALHIALDMLVKMPKQQKVFVDFLQLSHWDEISTEGFQVQEITRDELLNYSHCTSAILKQLENKGFLYTYEKEVGRLNHAGEPHLDRISPLSEEQQKAYNDILFQHLGKNVVLLHGVTSSGKTEIYIHLIRRAIEQKQQVLYLLPEIALTVQMRERLQRVFGSRLGIYHSKYSDAERVEIWRKQLSANPYDVILGARSAVFLPFQRLGLVIVDEEHETSFKQEDPAPRYHARSAAIMLAHLSHQHPNQSAHSDIPEPKVLLGTATPSLESYYNAMTGKYGLVKLMHRFQNISLPQVQIVDIRDLQRRKMMSGPFSPLLLSKIRQALERGEQVILFQNRRGFAPMVECRVCGWVPHCQHCDVSLTLHKKMNQLTCHYCGYTYQVPDACPNCGDTHLTGRGFGTEKVEDLIMEIFPNARVARMDLDSTRTRHAYERLITDFSAGRTNILIGTQMVTKGLDFDRVSVVGILNADSMLNYPDFRAYEHAFTMMAQVSGRSGRKGKQGLVVLQTKSPQLPLISQIVHNDYEGFFNDLLEERSAFRYPPYYHLVYVFLKHRYEKTVNEAGIEMGNRLRRWFGVRVLGPDKPAIAMMKSMHIRKLVLKLENGLDMKKARECLKLEQSQMMQDSRYNSLQVYYDVDPL